MNTRTTGPDCEAFITARMAQFRAESCNVGEEIEWPPMDLRTLAVALAVIALAMWISSLLPMGWLT